MSRWAVSGMKHVHGIELSGSHEEILPDFAADFPYIATCAELDGYAGRFVPWHWHRAVELFYMERGALEYTTPNGTWIFPAGSGGMVNSNVLHTARIHGGQTDSVQLLHLFEPALLAGEHASRIETRYILPLTASGVELIPLYPDDPVQAQLLGQIRDAFGVSGQEWGGELKLREQLTRIWLGLFELARPTMGRGSSADGEIKQLLVYLHAHAGEEITVDALAQAAHISQRACFRLFREKLHMTPMEYLRGYRLQMACQMLAHGSQPITRVAACCGLGSSSHFGAVFRNAFGCTPREYRRRWQDPDKNGR